MNNLAEIKVTKAQAKSLAKNLALLLKVRGLSVSDIAQGLNIPDMTVRRLVSGETSDPRISTLKLLTDYLGISIDAILDTEFHENSSLALTTANKVGPQIVPVLDWTTLAEVQSLKKLDLSSWPDWQPIALGKEYKLSSEAFALKSRPSMQPRFRNNTLLIIDPKEIAVDGDLVLVKLKKDSGLSLRELMIDSPKWQLQPIVPGSEIMYFEESEHEIIGVVVLTMLFARN